jgi:hypothetical protein
MVSSGKIFSTNNVTSIFCSFCVRGLFAKFVDSPYYSDSELCGGAVTVSFFFFPRYLPWQALHILQCSTHFSKTCYRPLITSKYLASELPFSWLEMPRNRMGRDLDCKADVLMGAAPIYISQAEHRIQFSSRPMRFLGPCRGSNSRSSSPYPSALKHVSLR